MATQIPQFKDPLFDLVYNNSLYNCVVWTDFVRVMNGQFLDSGTKPFTHGAQPWT
jgi:hypothetical protein